MHFSEAHMFFWILAGMQFICFVNTLTLYQRILKMKKIIASLMILFVVKAYCQEPAKPFIKLVDPLKEKTAVKASRQFLIGSTCKTCSLTVNDQPAKVYPTGAFAYEINLKLGDTAFDLVAQNNSPAKASKTVYFNYSLPAPPDTVRTLDIVNIETFPEGNLILQPGDKIKLKVKGLPGSAVSARGNIPLYEMPTSKNNPVPGIYQGEYVIMETDSFSNIKIPVTLISKDGKSISKESKYTISTFSKQLPNIAVTKGRLAHLLFGLGEDRLGGAKIGYLDSMVLLNVVGKAGGYYKVQLSKYRSAFIPDDLIEFLPKGNPTPESLTGSMRAYGDSAYDYISLPLTARLPYQSFQLVEPSKIVVDVFGAINNTNWITQLENLKEVRNVYYEQNEDEIFRIVIELKHAQHWGHQIFYRGNSLVIKIKQQPGDLSLNKLTIAVDAGHGGSNMGAGGPTGSSEKQLTLAVALKLQKALEQQGAKVIMTRTTEKFFDNKERILFYRDSLPDLLISIHLNSSSDPIRAGGTSTYYRYIGFRNLSRDIYKRMLELGLK